MSRIVSFERIKLKKHYGNKKDRRASEYVVDCLNQIIIKNNLESVILHLNRIFKFLQNRGYTNIRYYVADNSITAQRREED